MGFLHSRSCWAAKRGAGTRAGERNMTVLRKGGKSSSGGRLRRLCSHRLGGPEARLGSGKSRLAAARARRDGSHSGGRGGLDQRTASALPGAADGGCAGAKARSPVRSEERRVGQEWRSRW